MTRKKQLNRLTGTRSNPVQLFGYAPSLQYTLPQLNFMFSPTPLSSLLDWKKLVEFNSSASWNK